MHLKIRTGIFLILTILFIGTAIHSSATIVSAQTGSAGDSPATAPARLGEKADRTPIADDDVCNQRLLKALDALEKAERALTSAGVQIDAMKKLDDLKNQWIAVKDMIIAEQGKLIALLQSEKKANSFKSRLMSILKIAEKAAIVALGIIVGRGL